MLIVDCYHFVFALDSKLFHQIPEFRSLMIIVNHHHCIEHHYYHHQLLHNH